MYKISIPQPCHENWSDMIPQGNGAFCGQCSKIVVDFTAMTDEEVQNYLIQHASEKLCGRFKSEQVNNIRIEIPSYLIHKETSFIKKFLLITLVVFGTTLYSCTNNEGMVTGKTEFVMNSTDTIPQKHTLGKIAPPADTTKKSCNNPDIKGDVILMPADTMEVGEVAIVPEGKIKKPTIDIPAITGQVVMGAPIPEDTSNRK